MDNQTDTNPLPSSVRKMRLARDLSMRDLARLLNSSNTQLIAVEHQTCIPSLKFAFRLADALECEIEDIFRLKERVTVPKTTSLRPHLIRSQTKQPKKKPQIQNRILELRLKKKITQGALADALKTTNVSIHNVEKHIQVPSVLFALRASKLFRIRVAELFVRQAEMIME